VSAGRVEQRREHHQGGERGEIERFAREKLGLNLRSGNSAGA